MRTIDQEREAFEALLPSLLKEHPGKWAVVHDGALVGVFAEFSEAYAEGVMRFGHEAVFLVAPIKAGGPEPISVAWSTGVMFG